MPARTKAAALPLARIAAAALLACAVYLAWLPDVDFLRRSDPKTTSYIERYKRRAREKGVQPVVRMRWTPIEGISPHLRHAVIIAEDDMFYRHGGVDWESLRASFRYNWSRRSMARGASTITQQTARNLFLYPNKNPLRKLKEMLIAWKLERALKKDRILEIYLNTAEWGQGVYGIGAAAWEYFGKRPSELGLEESLSLAVALPSPRRLNPDRQRDPKVAQRTGKRKLVLRERMRRAGYL